MRGVRINGLDLDKDGSIIVESLATIYEDGEVVGTSYLASSLRKAVETHGPISLNRAMRVYNNGYFGAAMVSKGRVYIEDDSEAPAGARVITGPRGGKYYETKAGRGRPIGPPPEGWMPKAGERVRFRWPGDIYNGRLGRVREIHGPKDGKTFAVVDVIGRHGGAYVDLSEGKLVPAPYTSKEKREMKARDILIQEFGQIRREQDRPYEDSTTKLKYNTWNTEAGPMLMIKRKGEFDQPWMVQADSAVSMGAFLKSLPDMSTEALQALKDEIDMIIFSPASNPHDRHYSKMIGRRFTSNASMQLEERIMHIYPAAKDSQRLGGLAGTITHEVGHAIDDLREKMIRAYNDKLGAFWDRQEYMPADPARMRAIEEKHGIPPHPNAWMTGYGKWRDWDLGTQYPDKVRFWGSYERPTKDKKKTGMDYMMIGEKSWNDCSPVEKTVIGRDARKSAPVTTYAKTNDREYYAEAYQQYQAGVLDEKHTMYDHFKYLPEILDWIQEDIEGYHFEPAYWVRRRRT